jgi:RTX calcium-binding nonapeptide repeat (4 copies)/FG-GAP-like repeat/Haemolysin-type calcium binding protein related domain
MAGDLSVAQDYENYLDNREAINALIAANPDSAFAAGWIATFARVNDLGLNRVNSSDFLGGLVGYLDSVAKAGLHFSDADVAVTQSGSILTVAIKVANGTDIPGSLSVFADQVSESSDASGTTVQFVIAGLAAGAAAAGHDILIAGAAADTIHGGSGFDFIDGGAGDDQLYGDDGNDILHGGKGNDTLYGGPGDDTYAFARGDGADTLIDSYHHLVANAAGGPHGSPQFHDQHDDGGADSLVFGLGISPSDVVVKISGHDLIVGVKDPANANIPFGQLTDTVTLKNWDDPLDRIETMKFADGTILNLQNVEKTSLSASDYIGLQAFTHAGIWSPAGNGSDNSWHIGDFNGDGKADAFRYLGGEDMFLSNGSSFGNESMWSPAGNGSDGAWHVGDFNGDGKDDVFRYLGGEDVFLSNGSSFGNESMWSPAGSGSDGTWHVGDFNGDGKADIFRYLNGEDVFLSNGSSFGNESIWSTAGNGSDGKWYVGDFNGDGKDDIFRYIAGTGDQVFLSNGSSFVDSGVWTGAGPGSDDTWHVGDFNGDGKADIFRYLATTSGSDVFLSNGSGFVHDGSWTAAGIGSDNQWYVGDFNGGGADDIFRQLAGVDMFLSHFG